MPGSRPRIPKPLRTEILLANRHACCVCQRINVQIHHIDGDPSNKALENLAVLCLHHHDLATTKVGLTAKLSEAEVRAFKQEWEAKCRRDVTALARSRANVYAVCYKNPPRIRQLFVQLTEEQRLRAVGILARQIAEEENWKAGEFMYEFQAIPRANEWTVALLQSLAWGDLWPSCVPRVQGHPQDPDYPFDFSSRDGMTAFHRFDQYCQLMVRTLLLSAEVTPFEDIFLLGGDLGAGALLGRLTTFEARLWGREVRAPQYWKTNPVSRLWFRKRKKGREIQAELLIKTMYIFSVTAALELTRGRASGVGLLQTVHVGRGTEQDPTRVRIVPLMLGLGQMPVDLFLG
jgi:hypothetical protein